MIFWKKVLIWYLITLLVIVWFGDLIGAVTFSNLDDAVLEILLSMLIALPVLFFGSLVKDSMMKAISNEPQDSDDIIKYIVLEKDFVADLSKVIEDEGGIYMFMKKVNPISSPSLYKDEYDDSLIFDVGYKGEYWMNNVSSKITPAIIDKILGSPSVVAYLEKHKMSQIKNYLGNHIFLLITDPQFQRRYAEMLRKAGMDENLASREMTIEEKKIYWDVEM